MCASGANGAGGTRGASDWPVALVALLALVALMALRAGLCTGLCLVVLACLYLQQLPLTGTFGISTALTYYYCRERCDAV